MVAPAGGNAVGAVGVRALEGPGRGRNRGLLELDLKLDDLLEMQKEQQEDLDLEYVQFNVTKVLQLLNKRFARKRT